MKKIDVNNLSAYKFKQNAKKSSVEIFRYLLLTVVGYVIFVQLFYVLSYALRAEKDVFDSSVVWIPKNFTLENFKIAIEALDFVPHLITTLTIQVLSGLIEILTCAVPAYGFARFNFKGKNILFTIVLLTILIPPQMIAVSMSLNYAYFDLFGLLKGIGALVGTELRPNLLNSGFVFWLPSVFGVGLRSGLFIFIYRQFFLSLPKELEEAASIDGANALTTFVRVVIPSSGVAFLTVTIFSVVWHWNEYYQSVLFFDSNYPLSVSMKQFSNGIEAVFGVGRGGSLAYTMAAVVLCILPVLLMYIILQRKFIASIDRVGIVG